MFYLGESKIHNIGVFTSIKVEKNKLLFAVFLKKGVSGNFKIDFGETILGKYVNHSEMPNSSFILLENNLLLFALFEITELEEITVSYKQLIKFLGNYTDVESEIRFW